MNTDIKKSEIEGMGIFSTKSFKPGEYILTQYGKNLTYPAHPHGAFLNHQYNSNTKLIKHPIHQDYRLYASKHIEYDTEITLNYADNPYSASPETHETFKHGWKEIQTKKTH